MIQMSRSSLLILVYIGCLSIVQETAAYTCKKAGEVGCASCSKLAMCDTSLKANEVPCGSGKVCANSTSGAASCYTLSANPTPLCKCAAPYPGYKADPFDPNKYLMCVSASSQYTVSCPPDLVYDSTSKKCGPAPTVPPTPPPPTCSTFGFFGQGCNAYYACIPDSSDPPNPTPTEVIQCAKGEVFDASTPGCVAEADLIARYTPFKCEATPVAQMDSVMCNAFHICMAAGTPVGEKICCDTGDIFDSTSMTCVTTSTELEKSCPQYNKCVASHLSFNCSDGLASTSTTTISTISVVSSSSLPLSSTTSSFSSSISSSSSSSAISSSSSSSSSSAISSSSSSSSSSAISSSSSSSSSSAISSSSSSSTIPSSTTTTSSVSPSCTSDGAFPYPGDCSKYYWCSGGKSQVLSCPSNMLFDKVKRYCDGASSVVC